MSRMKNKAIEDQDTLRRKADEAAKDERDKELAAVPKDKKELLAQLKSTMPSDVEAQFDAYFGKK